MTDFDETDGDDASKLVKDLRKQIDKLSKDLTDARSETETLRVGERTRELSELVTSKGLDPRVAQYVPKDLSKDDAAKWLDDNGDMFARVKTSESGTDEAANGAAATPTVDAGTVSEQQRIQQVQGAATSPNTADIQARFNSVKTDQELAALIAELNGSNA